MKCTERSKDDEETFIALTGFRAENKDVKSESKKDVTIRFLEPRVTLKPSTPEDGERNLKM